MILAKAIAGDYSGSVAINVGALWSGPKADKFKGIDFIDESVKYKREHIKQVVYLAEEQSKSFLSSAVRGLAGGVVLGGAGLIAGALTGSKKSLSHIGIEFNDGCKVILKQSPDDNAMKCLILYAKQMGIYERDLGF